MHTEDRPNYRQPQLLQSSSILLFCAPYNDDNYHKLAPIKNQNKNKTDGLKTCTQILAFCKLTRYQLHL